MLEQAKDFAVENKAILIKAGGAVAGAVVGAIVAGMLTAEVELVEAPKAAKPAAKKA